MSLDAFIDKFGGWTEEYFFYGGEITLRYDVKNHVYLLLEKDGNLTPQDGVTTICHIIDKSEALVPWACKMMSQKLMADGVLTLPSGEKIVRQMSYQDYENLVLAAKTAHRDKLEDAGEVGHTAHAWIESYIKAVIAKDGDRLQEILAKFPADPRASNCCLAALEWMKNHNVRWLGTEQKIYSRKYKYAGTLDGLCLVDSCSDPKCNVCPRLAKPFKDRLTVSDWKTSNYLYAEYLLQTAAYLQAYNEENGYVTNYKADVVTDRWIIRLGKEDGKFEPWHAGAEDFRADFEAFRLALMLKREYEGIRERVRRKEQETRESIKAERRAAKEAADLAEKARKAEEKERQKAEREEALRIKCAKADKFKGTRFPKCNGGNDPCETCLNKYIAKQRTKHTKPFDYSGPCDGNHAAPACGSVHCWRAEYETNPARLLGPGYPECEGCGRSDETVELQPDPFMADVWDDLTPVPLCTACCERRSYDV